MELGSWLTIIKILNFMSAGLLITFQIWFLVDLIEEHRTFYGFMIRVWAPIFLL